MPKGGNHEGPSQVSSTWGTGIWSVTLSSKDKRGISTKPVLSWKTMCQVFRWRDVNLGGRPGMVMLIGWMSFNWTGDWRSESPQEKVIPCNRGDSSEREIVVKPTTAFKELPLQTEREGILCQMRVRSAIASPFPLSLFCSIRVEISSSTEDLMLHVTWWSQANKVTCSCTCFGCKTTRDPDAHR